MRLRWYELHFAADLHADAVLRFVRGLVVRVRKGLIMTALPVIVEVEGEAVVLIDPTDIAPVGFNVLGVGQDEFVADLVVHVLRELYAANWGQRTAEELLDDLGVSEIIEQAIPTSLQPYVRVDYQAFAHDLQLGGDVTVVASPAGGIWLFQPDA